MTSDPKAQELFRESVETGNSDRCMDIRKRIAQRYPSTVEGFFCKAFISHFRDNDLESAKIYYQKAIDLKLQSPEAYLNLGVIFNSEKAFIKAVKLLEKALELWPRSDRIEYDLAWAYLKLKKYDLAIKHSSNALKANPKNLAYLNLHARILMFQRNLNDSLKYCNLALEFAPSNTYLLETKANVLANLKKYDEAVDVVESIMQNDPNKSKVAIDLAIFFQQNAKNYALNGKFREAFEYYLKAHKCYHAVATRVLGTDVEDRMKMMVITLLASGIRSGTVDNQINTFILKNRRLTKVSFEELLGAVFCGKELDNEFKKLFHVYDQAIGFPYFARKYEAILRLSPEAKSILQEVRKEIDAGESCFTQDKPFIVDTEHTKEQTLEQARKHYFKALTFCERLNWKYEQAVCYEKIAVTYVAEHNTSNAIKYIEKQIESLKTIENYPAVGDAALNLIQFYNKSNNREKTANLYEQARRIFLKLNDEAALRLLEGFKDSKKI